MFMLFHSDMGARKASQEFTFSREATVFSASSYQMEGAIK